MTTPPDLKKPVFIQPASVQQIAALPYISVGGQAQVLLITSRERGRWILPKGWPVKGLSYAEAAAREAEEEAGVIGSISAEPFGHFDYQKRMSKGYEVRCSVLVYPLQVVEHRLDWKERGDRQMRWCTLLEAAGQVDDAGLCHLLQSAQRTFPTVPWTL